MRTFSENVKTLLTRDDVTGVYLVSIDRKASPISEAISIKDTSAPYDMVIPNLGTFKCDTGLSIVEAPRLSKAVDREAYKLTYIDPEFLKRSLFEEGIAGAAVKVYLCLMNTTGATLGGYAPDAYLTDLTDLIVVYAGMVDTQGYSINPDDGTVIAVLECSSPMAELGMTRPLYTSKEYLRAKVSTDSAFDEVNVGDEGVNMVWGKA